jgi:hypothetical protein
MSAQKLCQGLLDDFARAERGVSHLNGLVALDYDPGVKNVQHLSRRGEQHQVACLNE